MESLCLAELLAGLSVVADLGMGFEPGEAARAALVAIELADAVGAPRHHERLDGSGYHGQAAAAAIPFLSRLLAAADIFHALTEERAHRPARSADSAADMLASDARAGRVDVEVARAVSKPLASSRTASSAAAARRPASPSVRWRSYGSSHAA